MTCFHVFAYLGSAVPATRHRSFAAGKTSFVTRRSKTKLQETGLWASTSGGLLVGLPG